MARLDDLFDAARRASEPDEDAVARLTERLASANADDPAVARALRDVGAPSEVAAYRVAQRVRQSQRRRRAAGFAGATALAAAAVLAFILWPEPPPAPLDVPIAAAEVSAPVVLPVTEHVRLASKGTGHVTGLQRAPRIAWERGRIEVDVTPRQGIDLVVTTREAVVAVVGTQFAVDRTPLGTHVTVNHGKVDVTCLRQRTLRLEAGESVLCWPVDLGGLLGRARTLEREGADAQAVLDTLDRALEVRGPEALRGEILATQVRVLSSDARTDEARRAAAAYLDEGHAPRRDEMSAFLAASHETDDPVP